MKVLVIDIGGNNVKLLASGHHVPHKVPSGPDLTPARMVAGVKKVVVIMDHNAKDSRPKLLHECSLPLTGAGVVDLVITDLGVFVINDRGLSLVELAPDVRIDEIKDRTEADFTVDLAR